jgi:hypothetical protein
MSDEQDNLQDDAAESTASDDAASAGAEDLSGALNESGDGEFIVEEEKKPANRGSLVLFGLVLAGVGLTYLMFLRTGPKSADAAVAAQSAEASNTINTFLNDGGSNIKLMETMLKSTEKVVQQFLNYPSMTQVPLSALKTNPFRYATPKAPGETESEAAAKRRHEEERVATLKAVQGLNLQSVMHGGTRKACMINNTLVQEGQTIESFTVEKINPQGIIVKNGAYRFELKMQK